MHGPDRVYAGDIETDNSNGFGLDPSRSRVTEVAIATADGGEVFAHRDERKLLLELDEYLATLRPGLFGTWNGSFFDLPFLADRYAANDLTSGWTLVADPQLVPKYEPLPGHAGGYSGTWSNGTVTHAHLDISQAYKPVAEQLGVKWSLKPVCTALGIDMVELDRERLHDYTAEERKAYCLSDSVGTRTLVLRTLGWAS